MNPITVVEPLHKQVIIVGAGLSYEYGLPLGPALRTKILEGGTTILARFLMADLVDSGFGKAPEIERIYIDQAKEFLAQVRSSSDRTIDQFLSHSGHRAGLCKVAIASQLLKLEAQALRDVDFAQGSMHHVIKTLSNDIISNRHAVSVINFNYDTLIEGAVISSMLSRQCQLSEASISSALNQRIIHVYGTLAAKYTYDREACVMKSATGAGGVFSTNATIAAARGILAVGEERDDSRVRDRCRDLINCADSIVILGFGYDSLNIARIGLDQPVNDGKYPKITSTAYHVAPFTLKEIQKQMPRLISFQDSEITSARLLDVCGGFEGLRT